MTCCTVTDSVSVTVRTLSQTGTQQKNKGVETGHVINISLCVCNKQAYSRKTQAHEGMEKGLVINISLYIINKQILCRKKVWRQVM